MKVKCLEIIINLKHYLNSTYTNARNYAMKLAFYSADDELFERYIKGSSQVIQDEF